MARSDDARTVDVELAEDDEHPGPAGRDAAGAPDGRASARRRGLRGVGLAAVLVVLTGAVVANVVQERRDSAEQAALQGLPGVVAPMPDAPVELWASEGWTEAEVVGDALLVQGPHARTALLDLRTGERVAEIATEAGALCAPVQGAALPGIVRPTLISCTTSAGPESAPRAVTFHSADGTALATVPLPGPVLLAQQVGDDVVLVTEDSEGFGHVVRTDPVTGQQRWAYRTAGADGALNPWWAVVSREAVLLMDSRGGSTAVALADGTEATPDAEPAIDRAVPLATVPGGAALEVVLGERSTRTRVVRGGGDVLLDVEGTPATAAIPPSADEVVLHAPDDYHLVVHDLASGDPLWEHDDDMARVVVHLGEALVVATGDELQAWHPRTGDLLWGRQMRTETAGLGWSGLTDGERVLVPEAGTDGTALVAVDLASGEDAWRVRLPDAVRSLTAVGPYVVVVAVDDEVVVLGAR